MKKNRDEKSHDTVPLKSVWSMDGKARRQIEKSIHILMKLLLSVTIFHGSTNFLAQLFHDRTVTTHFSYTTHSYSTRTAKIQDSVVSFGLILLTNARWFLPLNRGLPVLVSMSKKRTIIIILCGFYHISYFSN
jgi:hypothetical protein